jgi:hypothetical protein
MSNEISGRYRAWRNLCVAAINAGLEQHVFGLEPWDGPPKDAENVYRFTICGRPAVTVASDIGYNEVSLHVSIGDKAERSRFGSADAYAHCDLERRDGAWLQTPHGGRGRHGSIRPTRPGTFRCTRVLLPTLAAVVIEPNGFKDHGRFMI